MEPLQGRSMNNGVELPNSPPYSPSLPLNHTSPPSHHTPLRTSINLPTPSPTPTPTPAHQISTINPNPPTFDEGPKVPRSINFKTIASTEQNINKQGDLKIYIPTFGVILVKPPRQNDLSNDQITFKGKDAILSGTLEIKSHERCKVKDITIGIQTVSHLYMGVERGWEDDAIFERTVKITQDPGNHPSLQMQAEEGEEGIWLDKGLQSFSFSLHVPSTLAPSDDFVFGFITHILFAKVQGQPIPIIPSTFSSFTSLFTTPSNPPLAIRGPKNAKTFEDVMNKSAALLDSSEDIDSRGRDSSPGVSGIGFQRGSTSQNIPSYSSSSNNDMDSPSYFSSRSTYTPSSPPVRPSIGSPPRNRSRSNSSLSASYSRKSPSATGLLQRITLGPRSPTIEETQENWMQGDLYTSRQLIVQVNPSQTGDVIQLDIKKDGIVDGLGSFRYNVTSDVFTVSSVLLLSLSIPSPSPSCTIFYVRLNVNQSYSIVSPRTRNLPPYQPASTKQQILYQIGQLPEKGNKYPDSNVSAIWRGKNVEGGQDEDPWKIRKVVRMPDHDNIAPSTLDGTISPIGVKHQMILQVVYSVYGENAIGQKIDGPGECRTLSLTMPVLVPSCAMTVNALNLPTYEDSPKSKSTTPSTEDMKKIFQSSWEKYHCMCGYSFEELGKEAMKRMQLNDEMEQASNQDQNHQNTSGKSGNAV
ncbi:uncharacterized protein L201_005701 [Kwoniella dendrophila CBS 6074]|uniref:Arrestin C-terminal-like domain-containing protein n=1 Tax=Kwoniella dendrophila CBS 6074 TaxID=1295534 RepID=A0AAX4K006_9TREE